MVALFHVGLDFIFILLLDLRDLIVLIALVWLLVELTLLEIGVVGIWVWVFARTFVG